MNGDFYSSVNYWHAEQHPMTQHLALEMTKESSNMITSASSISDYSVCQWYNQPSTSYYFVPEGTTSTTSGYLASQPLDSADYYTLNAYSRMLSPLEHSAQMLMARLEPFNDVPYQNPALSFGVPSYYFERSPPEHYTKREYYETELNNNDDIVSPLTLDDSALALMESSHGDCEFSYLPHRMPGFDGSAGRHGNDRFQQRETQGSRFDRAPDSRESGFQREKDSNKGGNERPWNSTRFDGAGAQNDGSRQFNNQREGGPRTDRFGSGFRNDGQDNRREDGNEFKSEHSRPNSRFDKGGPQTDGFRDGVRDDRSPNNFGRSDNGFENQRRGERFEGNRPEDRRDQYRSAGKEPEGGRSFDNRRDREPQNFGSKEHGRGFERDRSNFDRNQKEERFGGRDNNEQSFGSKRDERVQRDDRRDHDFGRQHESNGGSTGFTKPSASNFGNNRDFGRSGGDDGFRSNRDGGFKNNQDRGDNRDGFGGENRSSGFGGGRNDKGCFKCGEHGHRANECGQSRNDDRGTFGGRNAENGGSGFGGNHGGSGFGGCSGFGKNDGGSGFGKNNGSSGFGGNDGGSGFGKNYGSSGFRGNDGGSGFGGGSRDKGCFNCGEHGHRANECSQPRKNDRGSFRNADNGGGFGGSSFGNNSGRDNGGGGFGNNAGRDNGFSGGHGGGCFNCGQQGHRANECTEPKSNQRGGDGGRGGNFDDTGPRAPVDWAPEEENAEDLYAIDRKTFHEFDPSADSDVIISGPKTQPALTSWENSALDPTLTEILVNKMGFAKPRKIQAAVIPQVLAGVDVLAQAETGSGKTLAFVLPIVNMAMQFPDRDGRLKPFALVVTPTRELSQQIHENFTKMTKRTNGIQIRSVLCMGQVSSRAIETELRKGCDVIVGTPGKMMDFICQRGSISLRDLKIFVLDEADKMLNSNDNQHLQEIMNNRSFRERRDNQEMQTLLFSATVSDDFKRSCEDFLRKRFVLVASNAANGRSANPRVKQTYIETEDKAAKNDKLNEIFDVKNPEAKRLKTLIFVKRKDDCNFLAADLAGACDLPVASLSSSLAQDERSKHIKQFKNGQLIVLVATDVCARGIDIPELDRVIIFDMPDWSHKNKEEAIDVFVHRIGRTGRIKNGEAIIFIQPGADADFAPHLVKLCKDAGQQPPEFLENLANTGSGNFGGTDNGFSGGFGGFGGNSGENNGGFGNFGFGFDDASEQKSNGFESNLAFGGSGFGNVDGDQKTSGFGSANDEQNEFGKSNNMNETGFDANKSQITESFGQTGFGSGDEEDSKTIQEANDNDW